LSDKTYNAIRYVVWGVFPTLGTLYFVLAVIWGFPSAKEVLGSIVVIQSAFNVILSISGSSYKKSGAKYSGTIQVKKFPDKTLFSLELDDEPETLETKDEVIFRVNTEKSDSQGNHGL
jgi:hypothetical protein